MDLYDHPSLTNFDALQQLRLAAKSMRDLAFGLDQYASDPGLPAIHKISRELSRIGWNALYTSTLMAELADLIQEQEGEEPAGVDPSHFFQQLDALLSGINYFSKSIARLKRWKRDVKGYDEIKSSWAELCDRLREVARECKPF